MEILKDLIKQLDADGKHEQIAAVLEKFKPIIIIEICVAKLKFL